MTNKDEALKMAIKEMTDAIPHLDIHFDDYFEAINACKEALEQPAEPRLVSYALDGSTCTLNIEGEEVYFNREQPALKDEKGRPMTYWGGLEQPAQDYVFICKRCGDDLGIEYVPDESHTMTYEQGFAHGYEAHRVEKALEQSEGKEFFERGKKIARWADKQAQEPVAIIEWWAEANCMIGEITEHSDHLPVGTKLYTHPHQWQGLTDNEITELHHNWITNSDTMYFARAIEAKLKEKNT